MAGAVITGSGSGDGSGYGYGYGYGSGDGYGYGYGYGSGDGYGYGKRIAVVAGCSVRLMAVWSLVAVGCEVHTIAHWREHWREIAAKYCDDVDEPKVAGLLAQYGKP
jgi:hypothetical protein